MRSRQPQPQIRVESIDFFVSFVAFCSKKHVFGIPMRTEGNKGNEGRKNAFHMVSSQSVRGLTTKDTNDTKNRVCSMDNGVFREELPSIFLSSFFLSFRDRRKRDRTFGHNPETGRTKCPANANGRFHLDRKIDDKNIKEYNSQLTSIRVAGDQTLTIFVCFVSFVVIL